jgi:hypothetical protein
MKGSTDQNEAYLSICTHSGEICCCLRIFWAKKTQMYVYGRVLWVSSINFPHVTQWWEHVFSCIRKCWGLHPECYCDVPWQREVDFATLPPCTVTARSWDKLLAVVRKKCSSLLAAKFSGGRAGFIKGKTLRFIWIHDSSICSNRSSQSNISW